MSVGGFVPKPHTPFQWFGQNGVDELRRKISLLRDAIQGHARAGEVARPAGDVRRGHRRAAATGASAGSSSASGARAARSRSGASTSASTAGSTRCAAEGLDPDWYVTRHRTRDEVLPWDHIAAGLHADFLWQDWQAALAEHGLPDCRWTPCYDCGVCTDYALEHVVASPLAPAGGSQGTGQDLRPSRRATRCGSWATDGPAVVRARRSRAGAARGFPVRLRYTKHGKVRWISHRDVARALERAFRIDRAAARVHRGLLAPPEGELRARALDRARERRRVPRPRARATRSISSRCRRRSPTPCRRYGCHRRRAARRARAGSARSGDRGRVAGRARPRRRFTDRSVRARACTSTARSRCRSFRHRARKGREVEEDVRPVIRRSRCSATRIR